MQLLQHYLYVWMKVHLQDVPLVLFNSREINEYLSYWQATMTRKTFGPMIINLIKSLATETHHSLFLPQEVYL